MTYIYDNLQIGCKFTNDKGTIHWSHTEPLMQYNFNFDLYQAFKQLEYTKTWKQREAVDENSFPVITCNSKKAC